MKSDSRILRYDTNLEVSNFTSTGACMQHQSATFILLFPWYLSQKALLQLSQSPSHLTVIKMKVVHLEYLTFDIYRIQCILACSLISSPHCSQTQQFVVVRPTSNPPPLPHRHVRTPHQDADIGISLTIFFHILKDKGGNTKALFVFFCVKCGFL